RDYEIQEGDVVKVDLGATFNGAIADAAITVIKGKARNVKHIELVNACKEALENAIAQISLGKQIGVIGNAINRVAKKYRFHNIIEYGGHGIAETKDHIGIPHAEPFICNKAQPNTGVRFQAGMSIAIEPQFLLNES